MENVAGRAIAFLAGALQSSQTGLRRIPPIGRYLVIDIIIFCLLIHGLRSPVPPQRRASEHVDSTALERPAQGPDSPAATPAQDSGARGSFDRPPLLRVPLTLFRLTIIVPTLGLVVWKLVLASSGSNLAVNVIDFVLGAVLGLGGWWGGLYETVEPSVCMWYFHRDYSHEVLRAISSTTVAVIQTVVELLLVLPLLLNLTAGLKLYLKSRLRQNLWLEFIAFLLANIIAFIVLIMALVLSEKVLKTLKFIDTKSWIALSSMKPVRPTAMVSAVFFLVVYGFLVWKDTHFVVKTISALLYPTFRSTWFSP